MKFILFASGSATEERCNSDSKDKDENKALYEIYLQERMELIDAKREGARSFDKTILTLAAGAFGLSFAYMDKVVPDPRTWTLYILVGSWIFFCISLLSILTSFSTSQDACERQIEILAEEFVNNGHENPEKLENIPATRTRKWNKISIYAFITGVVLLTVFGAVNILS